MKEEKDYLTLLDLEPAETIYHLPLLVTGVIEKEDKTGSPYCILDLMDAELNQFKAKKFNTSFDNVKAYIKDGFFDCIVECSLYNGNKNYIVKNIGQKEEGITPQTPINAEKSTELFDKIIHELAACKDRVKIVALDLFQEHKEQMLKWTAGKSVHHTKPGDFLLHTYMTMMVAKQVGELYGANVDLLVVGASLHDIGKLYELDTDEYGCTEYTTDGQLFGHSCIGAELFNNKAAELKKEKINPESIRLVKHMILAHHGEKQFGTATVPITKEAFILHFADMIDSRLWIIDDALKMVSPGEPAVAFNLTTAPLNHLYRPEETG